MAELDSKRIASVALATLDRHGLEGFTMRAVADALSVTPMALYHHVKDKAALATLVVDAVTSERPLPSTTGNWRDDLWAMARWMRTGAVAHPHVAQLRRAFHVWTPAMLRNSAHWLGLWRQSGLNPQKAVLAATTSGIAIVGLMEEESILRRIELPDPALLSQLLPNVRPMFDVNRDFGNEFELAVRSLIDGLYARLAGKKTKRPRAPMRRMK